MVTETEAVKAPRATRARATAKAAEGPGASIDIVKVELASITLRVKGTSPLILNRLSEKAKRELLLPKGRKSAADKASSLKHDPHQEYRDSPYVISNDEAPTLIGMPTGVFKGAMRTAALDLPGAFKAQIGRLVSIDGNGYRDLIPIYGEPQLLMAITRMADAKHTPDVRTRAILPEWVAEITVRFVTPQLREQAVLNLLGAAGFTAGIGDWRAEKGSGNHGSFVVVGTDDTEAAQIMRLWGRDAQKRAMAHPVAYDEETESLLQWFDGEAPKRGFKIEEAA